VWRKEAVVGGIGLPANHCEIFLLGVDFMVSRLMETKS
jgi:hypothetical protein